VCDSRTCNRPRRSARPATFPRPGPTPTPAQLVGQLRLGVRDGVHHMALGQPVHRFQAPSRITTHRCLERGSRTRDP
jgi:hypothetical protein